MPSMSCRQGPLQMEPTAWPKCRMSLMLLGLTGCTAKGPPPCSERSLTAQIVAIARSSLEGALQVAAQSPEYPEIKRDLPLVEMQIDGFAPLESDAAKRVCSAQVTLMMGPYLGSRTVPVEYLVLRTEEGTPVMRLNRQQLEAEAAKAPNVAVLERLLGGLTGAR